MIGYVGKMLFNINHFLNDIVVYMKVREPLQICKHPARYFEKSAVAGGRDISVLAGDPGAGGPPNLRAGVGEETLYHLIVNKFLKSKNKYKVSYSAKLSYIKNLPFFINSRLLIRNCK